MSGSLFSFTEMLSLLGLVQSVYVLVYMAFRSGNWKYAIIPVVYFSTLALAFLMDAAATRWQGHLEHYDLYRWLFWFSGVPLGTLLILQIARTPEPPLFRYLVLLVMIPFSLLPAFLEYEGVGPYDMIYVGGLVAGAFSLLTVWFRRNLLDNLTSSLRKNADRFWLILALIVMQVAFLSSTFALLNDWLNDAQWILVRNILGIGFVYIAVTSLLRIYPQAIKLNAKVAPEISNRDQEVLDRLQGLFEHEKVYHEPELGRAELARELGVGEATLSRIVNIHYGKTIPQLLNDYRVHDAQRLLRETNASINDVFTDSGFSSMTTFNRVFKELSGVSPTEFRSKSRRENRT
jgi:AraC-like DNA-binding protein